MAKQNRTYEAKSLVGVEEYLTLVETNLDFFRWIAESPRRQVEVDNRLHNYPQARPFVETDTDQTCSLTRAGDMIYRAYLNAEGREEGTPASQRPAASKNGLSDEDHHRPPGWRRVVDALCEIDAVELVRYDGDAGAAGRRSGGLGTSSDAGTIRVVYANGKMRMPLLIETTARGKSQCQSVADLIARALRGVTPAPAAPIEDGGSRYSVSGPMRIEWVFIRQ